jgi:3-isopropylmalate/(R)-2-methylmalate dehydratase small subunit
MQKMTSVRGIAAPLKRGNVDTDQIIPAVFLKSISKTGFQDGLFARWRENPDFVLNQPEYQGAKILVAGPDFGTGSSREHAVWALRDYGFDVVLSARFGDIFRGNAGKQGLLAAQLKEDEIQAIWAAIEETPGLEIEVSLVDQTVVVGEHRYTFQIDEYTRWRLLEGLDDIALTLRNEDAITAFEQHRPAWMPETIPAKS